jgi:uncharacterized protein (TIGR02145 family)
MTAITFIGGYAVGGGVLKEVGVVHWNAPNTGAVDTFNFSALGSGYYGIGPGPFYGLKIVANLWIADEFDPTDVQFVQMGYNAADITINNFSKIYQFYFAVRLVKNTAAPPPPPLADIDGNIYQPIIIGTQIWIIENLRTTHYADGVAIPHLPLAADWIAEDGTPGHDGGYCAYNNDPLNIPDYGLLYNWYAVNNAHGLCYFEIGGIPEAGWRIPTEADWNLLVAYLGGAANAGGKLKETGLAHWLTPNTGATNEMGFTALPGGIRLETGNFVTIWENGIWWTSTEANPGVTAFYWYTGYNYSALMDATGNQKYGFSVRCVRDV